MTTSVDIVNMALEQVAAQQTITALNDGTPIGNAAGVIYNQTWQMLLRQLDPDFARRYAPLVQASEPAPPGWAYAYIYPSDCLRVRQVLPLSWDVNDPQPVRANIGIAADKAKIILTNLAPAVANAAYTTSNLTENDWDLSFTEATVRQLANPLGMAVAGRPDFAKELLQQAQQYEQMAELTDESSAKAAM